MQTTAQQPVKDEEAPHPIADEWRPTLREVAKALAEGDYNLSRGIPSVTLRVPEVAKQMREYVEDYGETLAELPDETWQSSFAQWGGQHWEVFVDLWTVESGSSDMVLSLCAYESGNAYRFEINALYVP